MSFVGLLLIFWTQGLSRPHQNQLAIIPMAPLRVTQAVTCQLQTRDFPELVTTLLQELEMRLRYKLYKVEISVNGTKA